ncbi:MAG: DUF308 domain-containing protein [Anaerolineae bacterium]
MATATAAAGDRRGRPWWITLVMGIAAVIFGGLLLFGEFSVQMRVYDLLVTLLGIWWLVDGIVTIVHLFTDRTRWGWNLFIGIVSIIAGLWILVYPIYAAAALPRILVFVFGLYAIMEGIVLLLMAFRGAGWGAGVLGVIALILGVVLVANYAAPGMGLALLWALAFLMFVGGFFMIWLAFRSRRAVVV